MLELPEKPLDAQSLFVKAWELFKYSLPAILSLSVVMAFLSVMMGNAIINEVNMDKPDWWRDLIDSDLKPYLLFYAVISGYLSNLVLFKIGQHYLVESAGYDPYQRALQCLFPMLVANTLYVVAVFLGSFALLVVGVFFLVSLLFYSPAILFERKKIVESLVYSAKLVKNNWWHTATVLALFILPFFIFTAVLNELLDRQGIAATDPLKLLIDVAIDTFFTPLIYAAIIVVFYDLKLRHQPSSPKGDDTYLTA